MENFNIRFREMNDDEFNKFREESILSYSKDLVKSGMNSEESALEGARKQFNELLLERQYTGDNYIYMIIDNENQSVGHIWYEKYDENTAFICDFLISEKFRKRGYGKESLYLIEKDAKEKGLRKIFLHVFKYNESAISLYEHMGYTVFKEESQGNYMIKDITI